MLTQTTALAPDGRPWQQVTLRNKSGMTVTVADWGATLLSAEVPLADGSLRRPLLGCAKLEDYARRAAFLGASVGRYANRIGHSRFPLDGGSSTSRRQTTRATSSTAARKGLISAAGALSAPTSRKCCSP